MRTIFETPDKMFRIIEVRKESYNVDDLAGDTFNPKCHPDIDAGLLALEYDAFIDKLNNEGVFGYILEQWNSNPGMGYRHIESCFGFVGQYIIGSKEYEHYIVEELKSQIDKVA